MTFFVNAMLGFVILNIILSIWHLAFLGLVLIFGIAWYVGRL